MQAIMSALCQLTYMCAKPMNIRRELIVNVGMAYCGSCLITYGIWVPLVCWRYRCCAAAGKATAGLLCMDLSRAAV